jgi:hypothetical protein
MLAKAGSGEPAYEERAPWAGSPEPALVNLLPAEVTRYRNPQSRRKEVPGGFVKKPPA